jgi:hypothetical protein
MSIPKWAFGAGAIALLAVYNAGQSNIEQMRSMPFATKTTPKLQARQYEREQYGPSLLWLDRLAKSSSGRETPNQDEYSAKLDFRVLSSLMVAGLASGFKSQVANLLWMKSDEYWHKGMLTRQNPLMELVVTFDPQFIDAWSTAGWHWAYNIYADIETNPKYKSNPKAMGDQQEKAVATGLDYLRRGSEQNPETYRLWFEHGWTRAEKAGYYDEETAALYRQARAQADARTVYKDVASASGKTTQVAEQGIDIIGRTIGHLYEREPNIDRALDQYGTDLLKIKRGSADWKALSDAGMYWGQYSSLYDQIVAFYRANQKDPALVARLKAIVPDIERMDAAQKAREKLQIVDPQPTGAFISLTARYLPAWELYKAGRYQQAVDTMIGVMNADRKYHLQKLDALEKVLALKGDSPEAITGQVKQQVEYEKQSTQEIGLHFLAKMYTEMYERQSDPTKKKELARLAYETWYRSRARNSLDFYAKRQTRLFEALPYGFTTPQKIVDEVKKSRKGGAPSAAPDNAPKVSEYYTTPKVIDRNEDGLDDATGKPVDEAAREAAEKESSTSDSGAPE